MNKKKSVDGFIPSKKNAGTYFKDGSTNSKRGGRGIPAVELIDDGDKELIKGIVPLPAPNGNDLKIKGYDDFISSRGVKKSKPVHTIEDFLSDADDESQGVGLDKPMSRTREGLLPDYEQSVDSDEELSNVIDDDVQDEKPTKKPSKLLFWQKDAEEEISEERSDDMADTDEDTLDDSEEDDFDIYNEKPKRQPGRSDDAIRERKQAEKRVELDSEGDLDNDLGVDDDDIERYRSRRFKREKKESFQDESNVVLRVIGGAVIVVVTIIATYFLFTLFYKAPEPAKIDDASIVENTTNTEEQKPEEKPVEVAEEPATVAVYNATTTAGLAKQLVDKLTAASVNTVLGTVNNGNTALSGTGYAILDFTGGKKPKGLAQVKELLGGVVEVVEVVDVTSLPADVQSDKNFVIIIR